jgi:phosphatidate cytidylyltransferase
MMKATTFQKRLMSGLTAGALVVLFATYMPAVGAWLVIWALTAIGQYEFYRMVGSKQSPVYPVLGLICGAMVVAVAFWTAGQPTAGLWELVAMLVTVLAIFFRQFGIKATSNDPIRAMGGTLLGVVYVPFLFGFLARLVFEWREPGEFVMGDTGRALALYFLCVVKFQDVGAYFTGRSLGKHKLSPRLSPKKTWEGVIGGVLTSLVVSLAFYFSTKGHWGPMIEYRLVDAIVLGVVLPSVGVVGDLFESLIKRASDAKDSGDIIPGMGGFLDILDSLLFSAPVMYIYIKLVIGA